MAPDGHTQPVRNGRELSLASPSNALVATCCDTPATLENALKAFQDVLDVDERKRLRKEMNVSCDASQVIAFTAGLDIVDPNRRGKSIATRLHSILETVQRFSEVVGIYVSSHPEIAALVWGSVRLAFTVLANFTSFFQTFSELLNGFDTLLPQFKEYQILFPDSLPLRNSVYDFHSAIISCCTQVISSTRRTWSQQAWASLTSSFESEIRPRVAEIRDKAELVKSQAILAKAQDDKKQRKWNSLLLRLSSYDYGSAFNQARVKMHRGTAEWIFNTSEFQDWYGSVDCSVLNVSGKIGSGKTILAANVISHLSQNLPRTCSILYIFVRFDDDNSRLADAILRSLIFQALTGRKVRDGLLKLLEKSASQSFERGSLLSLLGHFISLLDKTFLIVDGLDQCLPQEQQSLLRIFFELMTLCSSHGGLKILISARDSMAKEVDRVLAPTKHLRIGLADTNADLARYAEEILAEKRDTGQLVIGNEAIMDLIVDKLRTGGEGMFLWAFFTIEDICSCPTDDEIIQTLEVLPRKLSDTFNRALRRLLSFQPPSILDIVQRTFRWVATVHRPLTRWELGEALGVKVLQKSSVKGQIINGTERLPGWCENLVQIEAGDETVRFFHHSIKSHLLDMKLQAETPELEGFYIDLKAWDHEVGEVCLTYLNFSDFQRALTEFSPDTNSLHVKQIAVSNEGRSIPAAVRNQAILDPVSHTRRISAVTFLRRFLNSKQKKLGETLQLPQGVSQSEDDPDIMDFLSDYPFLLYTSAFWLHHTFHFTQSITKTWNLWKDRVAKTILQDDKFWANFGQQPPGFETFDSKSYLADETNLRAGKSITSALESKKLDTEQIALHKAIIFADFIAHRTLLAHILTTIHDRRHRLNPNVLESLLPTRRVFQFPLQREVYIRDENSHDGLVSLIAEFLACDGPVWPQGEGFHRGLRSRCNYLCERNPFHMKMIKIIDDTGYSGDKDPQLQLLAKIAVLKLTRETADAVETWHSSKNTCIHEFRIMDEPDILDVILTTGGPSSFKFARWVFGLHKNCEGRRHGADDWRAELRVAIREHNMMRAEFLLQQSILALEDTSKYHPTDNGLLEAIADSLILPPEFRSRAIPVAISESTDIRQWRSAHYYFKRFIRTGSWDITVALSNYSLKLGNSVSRNDEKQSWFRVFDDVLCCISQSKVLSCTQGWLPLVNIIKPTLQLCVRHTAEAKQAWSKPYPVGENDEDSRTLHSLHRLVYPAEIEDH